MYHGFKHTKAVTYDECMGRVFGSCWGLVANIMVFIHVFGAVVSTWIFSYFFLDGFVEGVLGSSTKIYFFWLYFGVTLIIIYVVATFADVEKLKFIAIVGFLIIVYLLVLFFAEIPEYFEYYNDKGWFKFEGFIASTFMFKTYGLTQYIFLNQYSVIPLCNNMKAFSFRRMKKVIFRTTILVFVIYMCVLLSGYMSLPSLELVPDDYKMSELFIMRSAIPGKKDTALFVGKALFGVTLFIATLVKVQFFILYFYQILKNIRNLRRGGTKNEILRRKYMKLQGQTEEQVQTEVLTEKLLPTNPSLELKPEERRKVMRRSNSAGRCIKFNVHQNKLPSLKEQSESKEVSDSENLNNDEERDLKDSKKQIFTISVNDTEEQSKTLTSIPEVKNSLMDIPEEDTKGIKIADKIVISESEERDKSGRKRELSFGNEKEMQIENQRRASENSKNEMILIQSDDDKEDEQVTGNKKDILVQMPPNENKDPESPKTNVFKTDQNSNEIEKDRENQISEFKSSGKVSGFNPESKVVKKKKKEKKKVSNDENKVSKKKMIINAVLLLVTTGLTLGLMNSLSTFLSAIGNFVGVFEIFVFPMLSVIIINRKKKVVSNWHLVRFL